MGEHTADEIIDSVFYYYMQHIYYVYDMNVMITLLLHALYRSSYV